MKRIIRSAYGDWIPAKIQIKGSKVRVSPKGKSPIIIHRRGVPRSLKPGNWFVQLHTKKKLINDWKPIKGLYEAKVKEFSARENEPPRPKTYDRTTPEGHPYQVQDFTVILEILSKDAKGATITYNVPFKFDYDEEDYKEKTRRTLQIAGRGKRSDALEEFLRITGVFNSVLPYKDNPLPLLQKAILKEDRKFNVQIEKGWVSAIYPSMNVEEDTDFDGGDTAPWED
ncbi:MAG: hypothetical protein ACXACY_30095 [Candidatus Hodarchaeales archaeon]|jgi:hypothetical protein